MDVFNELYTIAYTEEQINQKSFPICELEKSIEMALSKDSKQSQNAIGTNNQNQVGDHDTLINDNKEDEESLSALNVSANNQNKKINPIDLKNNLDNESAIEQVTTKEQTEEKLNIPRIDNKRRQPATYLWKKIYLDLKKFCEEEGLTLNRKNFNDYFGCNCDLNKHFISTKLYQFYIYNKDEHNKEVIKKMIKKEKDKFIYPMSCSFEYLYNKFIGDNNTICLNENDSLLSFLPTLEEAVKEKREFYTKKGLSQADIDKEIKAFEQLSKNFINNIKREGKQKGFFEREKKKFKNVSVLYEKMNEIELYFENKKNGSIKK